MLSAQVLADVLAEPVVRTRRIVRSIQMVVKQEVHCFDAGYLALQLSVSMLSAERSPFAYNLSTPLPLYSRPRSCLILSMVRSALSHSYSSSCRTKKPTLPSVSGQ